MLLFHVTCIVALSVMELEGLELSVNGGNEEALPTTRMEWESTDPSVAVQNIERIVKSVVRSLEREEYPVLVRRHPVTRKTTNVDFRRSVSRSNFAMLLHLMEKSYTLISQSQTATKRDIYYEDVSLYGNQNRLDSAISDVCSIIQVTMTFYTSF